MALSYLHPIKGQFINRAFFVSAMVLSSSLFMGLSDSYGKTDAMVKEENLLLARQMAANPQTLPIVASIFNQKKLDQRGIEDINQLQYYVPNLVVGRGSNALTLRGLTGGAGFDPGFSVYVNGVYALNGRAFDYYDLESVELLRGPQNTLYGRNSIAGSLNISYKKPDMNFNYFYGDIDVGNFASHRYRFVTNIGLIKNLVALRVAGLVERRDGYYEAEEIDQKLYDEDEFYIRTSLLYRPAPSFSFISTWAYQTDHGDGSDSKLIPSSGSAGDLRAGEEDYPQKARASSHFVTAVAQWVPDDMPWTIKSTSGYQFSKYSLQRDQDHSGEDLSHLTLWDDDWSFSTEIEIRSNYHKSSNAFLKRLDWVAGSHFWYEKTSRLGGIDEEGEDGGEESFNEDGDFTQANWEAFGQASYEIERATLTLGARYSFTDREFNHHRTFQSDENAPTPNRAPCDEVSARAKCQDEWHSLTWNIGVDYAVPQGLLPATIGNYIDSQLLYFTLSSGYRPGGFQFSQDSQADPMIDEEVLYAYEFGIKNLLWQKRIELNLIGFYYDASDLQLTQSASGVVSPIINADAEIYGIEIESRAEPISGLRINFGFGFQKSEITSQACAIHQGRTGDPIPREGILPDANGYERTLQGDDPECLKDVSGDDERQNLIENINGNPLPRTPSINFSLGVEYAYQSDLIGGFLKSRIDYVWRDRVNFYQFDYEGDEAASYGLLDLRISYEHITRRFGAEIYAENLFDKDAITNMEFGSVVSDNRVVYLNEPRTYGFKLFIRY